MKSKIFLLNLFVLFAIFFSIWQASGCKKEETFSQKPSALSIEKAKEIFNKIPPKQNLSAEIRSDSTENISNEPLTTPDWEKAETYFDEYRNISVVEVPLKSSRLSKIHIFNGTPNNNLLPESEQLQKLIFSQDSSGNINFNYLKISGSPSYLSNFDLSDNSFKRLKSNFEGRLGYYDMNDSLLVAYLVNDGVFFDVIQNVSPKPEAEAESIQERWGWCIDYWVEVTCPCESHTWAQRNICVCTIRPRRFPVMGECGGASPWTGAGGGGEGGIIPPPVITNPWHIGNGGNGSSGGLNVFMANVNAFNKKYGTNLLDSDNASEAAAFNCVGLSGNQYETCVKDAILGALVNGFLSSHNNSQAAQEFIAGFYATITGYNLLFLTISDLDVLFNDPLLLQQFQDYLNQHPDASAEEKKFAARFVFVAPEILIPNLSEKLNCFDIVNNNNNATFQTIALYVDQPIHNSDKVIDDRSGPFTKLSVGGGHTWLSITQKIGNETTILNVGLYPASSLAASTSAPIPGAFGDDSGHQSDVFVRWESISTATFNALIQNLKSYTYTPYYDLNNYNCTTWAVKQLENIGLTVPQNEVTFPNFSKGLCPGQLGQDLKANQPANTYLNTEISNAPPTTCN